MRDVLTAIRIRLCAFSAGATFMGLLAALVSKDAPFAAILAALCIINLWLCAS